MNQIFSGIFNPSLTIEDDLLIIIFSLIVILLMGIIFIVIRSIIFAQSIERILARKLKNKEYSEVIQQAKIVLEDDKSHKKEKSLFIIYYLAQAYEAINSLSNALKYFTEANVLASKNRKMSATILLHIAKIYDKLNKPRDALAYYIMLLELDESNSEALYDLAQIQYRNKNLKKAREYLEKLLRIRGGLIDARFLYGKILFESGNYTSAIKQFDLLEKYDFENFKVFFYKAKVLEGLRKYSEAIQSYQYIINRDWPDSEGQILQKTKEDCRIYIINLFIKMKDYHSGINYVSEYLSIPASDEAKIELMYLYANLLWNTGEEYTALKNFERVYMMKPDYKDVGIMYERYKKILPHTYLANYFTSNEENEKKNFESVCGKILVRHHFNLMYKHTDYYIYAKGVFYIVFYRHIEPIPFSKLTDMEVIMNSYEVKPQNIEIYSISGIRDDAVTHFLLKSSKLIEGDEFIRTIKRIFGKEANE
jgi:tetratricopeptide (TPR) repeat protein